MSKVKDKPAFDISNPIAELLRKRLYTGFFLTKIKRELIRNPHITAAIQYADYKLSLIYNPDFISQFSLGDQAAILEHEAYHVIFRHVFYMKNVLEKDSRVTPEILNIALDFSVNSYIKCMLTRPFLFPRRLNKGKLSHLLDGIWIWISIFHEFIEKFILTLFD